MNSTVLDTSGGIEDLPERIIDFMKLSRPSPELIRSMLLEAVTEINHLRSRLDESTDILKVYYAATLPYKHLMELGESRAVWMRDKLQKHLDKPAGR